MKLTFLGSGGGRHVMSSQVRKTGGLLFDMDKTKFVVDPGPGTLVHAVALGLRPDSWNGVVLTHFHIDHSTDANALLDGMKNPFLIAEEHCLPSYKPKKGEKVFPCIAPYYMDKVNVHPVRAGIKTKINDIEFEAVRADHYDPAVGFRIKTPAQNDAKGLQQVDIGYTSDGPYYRGMEKYYDGCKVLIVNTLVPKGQEIEKHKHMSVDNVIELLRAMKNKPSLVVLHHLSFWMMRSNLWKQEKIVQDAAKVKAIHSEDFMTLDLQTLAITKYKESKSTKTPNADNA